MVDRKFKDMQDAFENGDGKNRGSDRHVGFGSESQAELDEKVLKEYSDEIKKYNEKLNRGEIKYTPKPKPKEPEPEIKKTEQELKKNIPAPNKPKKQKKSIYNKIINIPKSEYKAKKLTNKKQKPKNNQNQKVIVIKHNKENPSSKKVFNNDSNNKQPVSTPKEQNNNAFCFDIITLYNSKYMRDGFIDIRKKDWNENKFYRCFGYRKIKGIYRSYGTIYVNNKPVNKNVRFFVFEKVWKLKQSF